MEISDIIPRKARCGRGSGIKSGMDMEFGKLGGIGIYLK